MRRFLTSFLLLMAATSGQAEAPHLATLQKIAQTATISLGHRESSVPFSYYDGRRQVVGYSHDVMLRVVDDLQAELKLPALAVKLVPVTSQNRIPLLQNGAVDMECGSTTHNMDRARQAAFSVSIFLTRPRLLTRSRSRVAQLTNLGAGPCHLAARPTTHRH